MLRRIAAFSIVRYTTAIHLMLKQAVDKFPPHIQSTLEGQGGEHRQGQEHRRLLEIESTAHIAVLLVEPTIKLLKANNTYTNIQKVKLEIKTRDSKEGGNNEFKQKLKNMKMSSRVEVQYKKERNRKEGTYGIENKDR